MTEYEKKCIPPKEGESPLEYLARLAEMESGVQQSPSIDYEILQVNSPVNVAIRKAFDNPTYNNIKAVADIARQTP